MSSVSNLIQERSISIPIINNFTSSFSTQRPKGEYSLKQNFFDPTKSSPPNKFMIKLQKRMSIYNPKLYSNINDDALERE